MTAAEQMNDAFNRAQAEIDILTDWIECEFENHHDEEITWDAVHAHQHARQSLIEAMAFLANVDQSEIKSKLDELFM